MKNSIKLVAGCFLAATAFVVSGSAALAGEGGAAGSVSAKLSGVGNITGVSSSIAVGKNAAATTGHTNGTETFTSAVGGAGVLTVTGANTTAAGYGVAADTNLAVQANQLNGTGNINAGTGVLSLP
jgi:hypothetical protein